ncbi:MAG: nitroreductase family protein [bacterium]
MTSDKACGFADLVRQRRSCRTYKTDAVPPETVARILDSARLAPSACNKQPWRFAVVTDQATRLRLVREGLQPGIRMEWAAIAPVIFVLGIRKDFITHRLAPRLSGVEYPLLDLGIAGEHLVLQATELGLGTCWIGWIRPRQVRRIVDWPGDITPQALITLGWPALPPSEPRPRLEPGDITKWI